MREAGDRLLPGRSCQRPPEAHSAASSKASAFERAPGLLTAYAAIPSSFSPLATILSASSGNGRWSSRALGASAASQRSTSAGVIRITGIAFGWIGAMVALASVVRKAKSSCSPSIGALLGPRTPRQGVHRPAKTNNGLASHFGALRGFFVGIFAKNDVAGTMLLRRPQPSLH
jgi:hypothetical protein